MFTLPSPKAAQLQNSVSSCMICTEAQDLQWESCADGIFKEQEVLPLNWQTKIHTRSRPFPPISHHMLPTSFSPSSKQISQINNLRSRLTANKINCIQIY